MSGIYTAIITVYLCAGALICWKFGLYEGAKDEFATLKYGDTSAFLKTILWFVFLTVFWLPLLVLGFALVLVCAFISAKLSGGDKYHPGFWLGRH